MNLLPSANSDFAEPQYWDKFFKSRGEKVFEWYGEYLELCSLLHKYMKVQDTILVSGCGNSKLSADLYDAGFRSITNVDISPVVVKQMSKKYCSGRPQLKYEKMDVLNLTFQNGAFNVVLDKGTLDALMPDNLDSTQSKVETYFSEIDRVLKIGGRYICISLLQSHILKFLINKFSSKGWLVRICLCSEAEKSSKGSGLPIFVVVCTKFKLMVDMKPVFEFCLHEDSVKRLESKEELIESVEIAQQGSLICNKLSRVVLSPEDEIVLDVLRPQDKSPRYSITVVDKIGVRRPETMTFAAFIVPQGRENDWLFGNSEGRQVLLENCKVDRVAIITMHRGHEYPDLKGVQEELNEAIINVAPHGVISKGQKIQFLSFGSNLGSRKTIFSTESELSGSVIVEDVETDGHIYRRLVFLKRPHVIQSEARLEKGIENGLEVVSIDKTYISCEYHIYIGMGILVSILQSSNELKEIQSSQVKVLLLGLGGGNGSSYIQTVLPEARITAVDIDPIIVQLATEYFGLVKNEKLEIVVQDGLDFMKDAEKNGDKYDVIIFDVDTKDASQGLSCPPQSFLEPWILSSVTSCLSEKGIFILNLVCRATDIKNNIYAKLKETFKNASSVKLEKDVNEVLYMWQQDVAIDQPLMIKAAEKLNSLMEISGVPSENFIDVDDLPNWIRLNLQTK